jgi:hypothetical protein
MSDVISLSLTKITLFIESSGLLLLLNDQLDDTKRLEKELTAYMENEHERSGLLKKQVTEASSTNS